MASSWSWRQSWADSWIVSTANLELTKFAYCNNIQSIGMAGIWRVWHANRCLSMMMRGDSTCKTHTKNVSNASTVIVCIRRYDNSSVTWLRTRTRKRSAMSAVYARSRSNTGIRWLAMKRNSIKSKKRPLPQRRLNTNVFFAISQRPVDENSQNMQPNSMTAISRAANADRCSPMQPPDDSTWPHTRNNSNVMSAVIYASRYQNSKYTCALIPKKRNTNAMHARRHSNTAHH